MNTETRNIDNFLQAVIKKTIEAETEEIIKKAIKDLEKRVPEIITSISIEFMKTSNFQILQDRIIFTIEKK